MRRGTGAKKGKLQGRTGLQRWKALVIATKRGDWIYSPLSLGYIQAFLNPRLNPCPTPRKPTPNLSSFLTHDSFCRRISVNIL